MGDEPDPERGGAAALKLRALGVTGILITAAELGYITQLACKMPECFCPEELGGACYFDKVTDPMTNWAPNPDHYPRLQSEGGQLAVDNVRLAHVLCNRVDYSKRIGRPFARDLASVKAARDGAILRMKK